MGAQTVHLAKARSKESTDNDTSSTRLLLPRRLLGQILQALLAEPGGRQAARVGSGPSAAPGFPGSSRRRVEIAALQNLRS